MTLLKNGLRVIEGGGQARSDWLDFPSTALGRSPTDRSRAMSYRIARPDIDRALEAGRRQPLFDLWTGVIGQLPPVSGIERFSPDEWNGRLPGIYGAHACFRGLKRPVGRDCHGFDYLAFVTKPKWLFRYAPNMACCAEPFSISEDLVFATYARLDYPDMNRPRVLRARFKSS